jgi:hypothetical protein
VHLYERNNEIRIRASAVSVNWRYRFYEEHELFDLPVPLALETQYDLLQAMAVLEGYIALAHFISDQRKMIKSGGTPGPAGGGEAKASSTGEGRDHDGGGDGGDQASSESGFNGQGGMPPKPIFNATPGKSRKSTLAQAVAPITLTRGFSASGAHALVFRGQRAGGLGDVALKLSDEADFYLRELCALHRLAGVSGVVQLLDVRECDRGLVLVLPWLWPVAFGDLQPRELLQLVQRLLQIVACMHASGVAHCDLKPDAFMRTNEDELVLVDFNLARGVDEVLDGDLPGTAGWVFTGTPAATGAMVDRVALASVIGWLMHVPGCGEPDTSFEGGVVAISDACAMAEGPHLMLLQAAKSLLSSECTLSDTVALLASPAVRVSERAKENALPTRSASKKPVDPRGREQRVPLGDIRGRARV